MRFHAPLETAAPCSAEQRLCRRSPGGPHENHGQPAAELISPPTNVAASNRSMDVANVRRACNWLDLALVRNARVLLAIAAARYVVARACADAKNAPGTGSDAAAAR